MENVKEWAERVVKYMDDLPPFFWHCLDRENAKIRAKDRKAEVTGCARDRSGNPSALWPKIGTDSPTPS